jgi:hypothetical protein
MQALKYMKALNYTERYVIFFWYLLYHLRTHTVIMCRKINGKI